MPRFVVYAALTVGSLFAPAIARGLKAIGDRLYRPPQGRLVLAATCALAIAGVRWAMINRTAPEGLKVAVVIGLPTIALCAMFIARDQYRAARGLPPVSHHAAESVTGITRWALIALGVAGLAVILPGMWTARNWGALLSATAISVSFITIGIRRQITPRVGELLGDPPDPGTLD
jgi:hypothetical protein